MGLYERIGRRIRAGNGEFGWDWEMRRSGGFRGFAEI
jgi:hypothetical protein